MKTILFLVSLLFLCAASVQAKAEHPSICQPRVPAISYSEAISIAKKSISAMVPYDETFIDQAIFNCSNSTYTWVIGFRRKSYESGHFLVYVSMDSSIETSVVKDG